jgi:hypothetical protein
MPASSFIKLRIIRWTWNCIRVNGFKHISNVVLKESGGSSSPSTYPPPRLGHCTGVIDWAQNIHMSLYSSITFLINYFPIVLCFITHTYSIYNERWIAFRARTLCRKCSFVTKIIQNIYSMLMARVDEIAQNATADWGNLLTSKVTSDVQPSW